MSQHQNTIEAVLGAVVLAAAAMFLWFAYTMADLRSDGGYSVNARFDKIGGLKIGSDVRLSGIKVGTISHLSLDEKNFMANVGMTINDNIHLPVDTVAEVASEGLLGGNYLSLVPGSEDKTIPTGGQIKYTQSPVDLVQLLGRFIFSTADKAKDEGASAEDPAAAKAAN